MVPMHETMTCSGFSWGLVSRDLQWTSARSSATGSERRVAGLGREMRRKSRASGGQRIAVDGACRTSSGLQVVSLPDAPEGGPYQLLA